MKARRGGVKRVVWMFMLQRVDYSAEGADEDGSDFGDDGVADPAEERDAEGNFERERVAFRCFSDAAAFIPERIHRVAHSWPSISHAEKNGFRFGRDAADLAVGAADEGEAGPGTSPPISGSSLRSPLRLVFPALAQEACGVGQAASAACRGS